jgi:hypothetical protein
MLEENEIVEYASKGIKLADSLNEDEDTYSLKSMRTYAKNLIKYIDELLGD